MKILICDKTEKEYIEQMRAAGLTVDVRTTSPPRNSSMFCPPMMGWSFARGPRSASR